MTKGRVVMGLLFFPRGGSAQVARYLSIALADAGWGVELVAGSVGSPGEETHAPTFFGDVPLRYLDYSAAVAAFEVGGSAVAAPVPMHPSYEDREDAPDVVFAAVADDVAEHLGAVWESPFAAAGSDDAEVFHLHHLTPQYDAVLRRWPSTPIVAHLHGTEIKFLEAVAERTALAVAAGTSLTEMPDWVRANPHGLPTFDDWQHELLRTTRWEQWRHGDAWRHRLRRQAAAADHLVVVSPGDRETAIDILGVDATRVSDVPNGVDVEHFAPRLMSGDERRAHFREWLVEDGRGWDGTGVPGSIRYREDDLDRLLGGDDDGVVFVYVGRFTAAKRVPTLVRAFARAAPRFERPASLLIWGGHPGEWEGEHPVTVARDINAPGVFFSGWRGHEELPLALAACDVLVMPSVNDSYPQTPLEAMATGLPVLATKSGGFPLMVKVDASAPTGWLVPPDDEQALADALVSAANAPEEIQRRGAAALLHARTNLSWAGRVARFEDAYAHAKDARAKR